MEYWGLWRIEVFWLVVPEHSATEGNGSAARIANRKHNAVTKSVVALELAAAALTAALTGLSLDYHTGLEQIVLALRRRCAGL
jgi:hypothetical protein